MGRACTFIKEAASDSTENQENKRRATREAAGWFQWKDNCGAAPAPQSLQTVLVGEIVEELGSGNSVQV